TVFNSRATPFITGQEANSVFSLHFFEWGNSDLSKTPSYLFPYIPPHCLLDTVSTMIRMSRILQILVVLLVVSICEGSIFHPISEPHRSAAPHIFAPVDGSGSLEEKYQALRSFEILKIEKSLELSSSTCTQVDENLQSSSGFKDVYYALKCNQILKCKIDAEKTQGVTSRLRAAISDTSSLSDYYYTVGSLVLIKAVGVDVQLRDADKVFRSIKSLSQSDGRWRYNSNNPMTSTHAAGIAFETLAGVVALAEADVDPSLIDSLKNGIVKLFDSIEKYDDGSMYFDEKDVGEQEYKGPLVTSSSVLQGLMTFADVTSGSINAPPEKILGLAKFFLSIGVPGTAQDFFNQINSLAWLENNQLSIPLILSVPATVLSLSGKDPLKVSVTTVLGSSAPRLAVKILKATDTKAKSDSIIKDKELKFDASNALHVLDVLPIDADIGIYSFVFEIVLSEAVQSNIYATGVTQTLIYVTGAIKVDSSELTILDSDLGNIETRKTLDIASKHSVSLSANHLQKLRLSFQLSTPLGHSFNPHQAILKLRHESKVEHVFVMVNSGKQFEITLDFLGLVEKLYYLSGKYDIELSVGDALMENSFLWSVSHVDLELPEAPEKATRPPSTPANPYSRYGPKAEISHIFRSPEKLPSKNLSLAFSGLILLPLVGFLIGLLRLGVNFKNFPSSGMPAISAILFHVGVAAVLGLYFLFWLKLNLFVTLKILGFLGVFLYSSLALAVKLVALKPAKSMPTDSKSEKKKRSSASNSEGRDVSKRRRTSDDEEKSGKGSSRRDKGESGKSHKRSKRHSDKEKSKEKHKSKDSKHSRPSLKPHELSSDDYFSKNKEFATWLKEDKNIFFSDLSSERARELFSDFVKRWNKDKLNPKYYEGIATAPRTAHNWKIRN
ncbi:hypothetical protein V2J09_019648, partial [Rumex salicifolius]